MDNNYLVDIQHERLSFFTPAGEVKALNDVSIHLKERGSTGHRRREWFR